MRKGLAEKTNEPRICPHCRMAVSKPKTWLKLLFSVIGKRGVSKRRIFTQKDLAKSKMGVTRERARQLCNLAVKDRVIEHAYNQRWPLYRVTDYGYAVVRVWKKTLPANEKTLRQGQLLKILRGKGK